MNNLPQVAHDAIREHLPSYEHPLVRRFIHVQPPIPRSDFDYHPVPNWRDITGTYDAIIQFRDDLLLRYFKKNAPLWGVFEFDYEPDALDEATRQEIDRLTPHGVMMPVPGPAGGFYYARLTFEPYQIRIRLQRTTIQLHRGTDGLLDVAWDMKLIIVYRETDDSLRDRRRRIPGFEAPPPDRPEIEEIEFAVNRIHTQARLQLESVADQYLVWANLDFGHSMFSLERDETLARAYLGSLTSDMLSVLDSDSGGVAVTPRIVMTGYQGTRQVSVNLGQMYSYFVVTAGNIVGSQILHICLTFEREAAYEHLDLVRPFVGDKNYGIYQSDDLVLNVLRAKWGLLSRRETEFVLDIELPLGKNGTEVMGRGRFNVRLNELLEAAFETAADPEREDFIALLDNVEFQLLRVWDELDQEIEVASLGVTSQHTESVAIMYSPFQEDPYAPELSRKVGRLMTNLLLQMYRPLHIRERLNLRDIGGYTSQPLGAIFVRGNL